MISFKRLILIVSFTCYSWIAFTQAGTKSGNASGTVNITEIGYGLGFGQEKFYNGHQTVVNEYNYLKVSSIFGYNFNEYFMVGGGIGLDVFNGFTYTPLFLDLRGSLPHEKINLSLFVDIGYNNVLENKEGMESGIYQNSGISLSYNIKPKRKVIVSIAYARHKLQTTIEEWDNSGRPTGFYLRKDYFAKSINLKLGLIFE